MSALRSPGWAVLTRELSLVESKPWSWLPPRSASHPCMQCKRSINWKLIYCLDCSWRGEPIENVPWPAKPRSV